jgi:hypothetical protein
MSEKFTNLEVNGIIEHGTLVCQKLYKLYSNKSPLQIADTFTKVKIILRKLYPESESMNDYHRLKIIKDYSIDDMKDLLEDFN